jgi:hypothetical protein
MNIVKGTASLLASFSEKEKVTNIGKEQAQRERQKELKKKQLTLY